MLGNSSIPIAIVDAKLYYYFLRSNSLSVSDRSKKRTALIQVYLKYAKQVTDDEIKKQYLLAAVKRALSTRYSSSFNSSDNELLIICNDILRSAQQEMRKNKCFSKKELFKYGLLSNFPFIYRLWRIMDDPSMLNWERKKREKMGIEK